MNLEALKPGGNTMYRNIMTGEQFNSKLEWQETMAIANPCHTEVNAALNVSVNDCAVVFLFGRNKDCEMIARTNDGKFYTCYGNADISADDPQKAIDFLWNEMYFPVCHICDETFTPENGEYSNTCPDCGEQFTD
jgi:uncharacterized CHY-type Zn-finger protein